jgi:hypothetical protein
MDSGARAADPPLRRASVLRWAFVRDSLSVRRVVVITAPRKPLQFPGILVVHENPGVRRLVMLGNTVLHPIQWILICLGFGDRYLESFLWEISFRFGENLPMKCQSFAVRPNSSGAVSGAIMQLTSPSREES